jgi:hypothetical protein
VFSSIVLFDIRFVFPIAKCRLPDLGKYLIGYYMDEDTNEWYGKELQSGTYIRNGHSIKYQCQCHSKSIQNCSLNKPAFTQCMDGQWTNGGPYCQKGNCLIWIFFAIQFFDIKETPDKCQISFDTPHILLDNNTQLNNMINEGESFNYECIHGYIRMTNVTCIQGSLTSQPLCEPSRY